MCGLNGVAYIDFTDWKFWETRMSSADCNRHHNEWRNKREVCVGGENEVCKETGAGMNGMLCDSDVIAIRMKLGQWLELEEASAICAQALASAEGAPSESPSADCVCAEELCAWRSDVVWASAGDCCCAFPAGSTFCRTSRILCCSSFTLGNTSLCFAWNAIVSFSALSNQ